MRCSRCNKRIHPPSVGYQIDEQTTLCEKCFKEGDTRSECTDEINRSQMHFNIAVVVTLYVVIYCIVRLGGL